MYVSRLWEEERKNKGRGEEEIVKNTIEEKKKRWTREVQMEEGRKL